MGVLRKFSRKLCRSKSGNAAILVGLGMPALMGGAGLAVDTAQWYLWQRELQFAADQAALAAAWSRGNGDTTNAYITRADQEFSDNLSITGSKGATHTAALADYDGGTQNSVVVTAEVTANLPFAGFVMGRSATIRVNAQATWETMAEWRACMLALDKTQAKGLWFNGGPTVNAACGVGSLSNNNRAVEISGSSGTYDVGWVATSGKVVDPHGGFSNAQIAENVEDLYDPFDSLTPPDNPTPRSLSCGSSTTTYTADELTVTTVTYSYFIGRNANQAISYNAFIDAKGPETTRNEVDDLGFTSLPADQTQTTTSDLYQVAGSGPDKVYEQATTTSVITYSDIDTVGGSAGSMQPGTYSDFTLSCDTTLAGGIYVIDGGELNVNAQYSLTGSGVMFVLKNGAGLKINGGADIELTAMTVNELIAAGVSAGDADDLAGMLIFEDPNSNGANGNKINGNAKTFLNGVIYTPKSDIEMAGTAAASSNCLMIASKKINISGTADLSTFCAPGETNDVVVGSGGTRVRLVA